LSFAASQSKKKPARRRVSTHCRTRRPQGITPPKYVETCGQISEIFAPELKQPPK
jgi:hypothetical protein